MYCKSICALVLINVLVIISLVVPARAGQFPGASGMAVLDDSHLLIVQDVKIGQPGSPLGVLTIDPEGGYGYVELAVEWPERQANDLESCFALPERPGEFLVAESGSYHEVWYDPTTELYAGRIYHIHVTPAEDGWDVEVLQTLPIPLDLHEVEGMVAMTSSQVEQLGIWSNTPINSGSSRFDSEYRIDTRTVQATQDMQPTPDATVTTEPEAKPAVPEGPVAYKVEVKVVSTECENDAAESDRMIIVLATRGGQTPYEPVRLHWGIADLATGEFECRPEDNLPLYNWQATPAAWERGCSDLYLDEAGVIWVATAYDLGDAGPFRSTVYRFGEPAAVLKSENDLLPAYSMLHIGMPPVSWEVEGLKIEAIAAPMIEGAVLSYATDDEGYGGVWRTLAEAR